MGILLGRFGQRRRAGPSPDSRGAARGSGRVDAAATTWNCPSRIIRGVIAVDRVDAAATTWNCPLRIVPGVIAAGRASTLIFPHGSSTAVYRGVDASTPRPRRGIVLRGSSTAHPRRRRAPSHAGNRKAKSEAALASVRCWSPIFCCLLSKQRDRLDARVRESYRRADSPRTSRGDAAAATWIFG